MNRKTHDGNSYKDKIQVQREEKSNLDLIFNFEPTAAAHLSPEPVPILAIENMLLMAARRFTGNETSLMGTFSEDPRTNMPTFLALHW
jgi:hypothetical protein